MPKFENPIKIKPHKTPTYNMTAEQLDAVREAARTEGVHIGIYLSNLMYSAAMLMALRDTLGYGQARLVRIFKMVQGLFDEIVEERISYEDLAKTLEEECGIRLIIERPDNTPVDAMDIFQRAKKEGWKARMK